MIKEGNFGLGEAVCLTSLMLSTKIFYTSPVAIVRSLGTSAWYATLLSCAVGIVFFMLLYVLMKRFPGKNLTSIFEVVLGKFIGKVLSLVFCLYLLYYAASNLREFLEIIKAYSLPYTPPSLILASFILIAGILCYIGLEGIARLAYVSAFPILAGMMLLFALAYTYYEPDHLMPILGYGIRNAFFVGLLRSSAYSEVIILAFIINSIHGLKNFKKAGLLSLAISGTIISVALLLYTMAFQYTVGSENLSGLFQLSRIVYLSRFLQRVESIFIFIWVAASVVTVATAFYIAISIYCKTFNIKNHKPLILPFSYFLFIIAIMPKNLSEVVEVNMLIIRQYSLVFVFFVPILVLLISIVLGKKGEKVQSGKT